MKLEELFSIEQLTDEIEGGFVSARFHPQCDDLVILNYTPEAQFSHRWNDVTRKTRGLIYNKTTMEVLARPFPKIHNWDEPEAPPFLAENAPVYYVGNKFDGSLGIMYRLPNGRPAIATRGSFSSEQAIKGTEMLHDSGMAWVYDEYIESGMTPLFEIIYPENRIVLDYGNAEFLEPLGFIHIESGAYIPPTHKGMGKRTFHEIRMDLSRPNSEGWVVWRDEYTAVKIKQADYVELHRVVTGLNRKSIWRAIKDGTYETMLAQLPDELYKWAEDVAAELWASYGALQDRIVSLYATVYVSANADPKEYALAVQGNIPQAMQGYMYSIRQGKDITEKMWASIEPKGGDR